MKNALVLLALVSCLTTVCHAASPPPVPEGLLACSKVRDVTERVRCYDAQIAAMNSSAAPAAASPEAHSVPAVIAADPEASSAPAAAASAPGTAAPSAAAPAASASATVAEPPHTGAVANAPVESSAAQFGAEDLRHSHSDARREQALLSNITAVRKVGPNIYTIALSNGQIWREDGSSLPMFFHTGDGVRIEKGSLGSYQLSTDAAGRKNWVQATRIQ